MTQLDQIRLLETLKQCLGRIMISSYDSPHYSRLLANWSQSEKSTYVQFSNHGNHRTEIVWKKLVAIRRIRQ